MPPSQEITRYVCLFHDAARARAAVRALEGLGVAAGGVTTLGDSESSTGMTPAYKLTDLGVPERDLEHLQDGLRNGGVVVSLEAPESQDREIERIFHRFSADKIDEAELQLNEPVLANEPVTTSMGAAAAGAGIAALGATPVSAEREAVVPAGEQAVIPVAEEQLVVGKREVDRGGVRVFRRTVEQAVSEDVDLHGERVVLEYREVNRPATEADVQAGRQEIELVETTEVPVVQKVARVVEEVHVGKVETDRTETVEDSVRHTEVNVEPIDNRVTRNENERF